MDYNFDQIIDRSETHSVKWDLTKIKFGQPDVLPLWVADMDFETPDFIRQAIIKRAQHPIYGYTLRDDRFSAAVKRWMYAQHQWNINQQWVTFGPGIVSAIATALLQFTHPGDKVIIQTPVYFPFRTTILDNGRQVSENKLLEKNGRYEIDFDDLERRIDKRTKIIILSNPHNPVGRVFSHHELNKLGELALKNNLLIFSDEIHSDLIFEPHKHIPIASISPEIANQTITMVSASKSFNVAGLSTSAIIISNPEIRQQYNQMLENMHLYLGNIFGNEAIIAAYTHGNQWIKELMLYLTQNVAFVREYLQVNMPKIKLVEPESTYLLWLDFRALELNRHELKNFVYKKAKIGLNEGATFGDTGNGFMRLNIACPLSFLKKAMKQLHQAYLNL